MFQRSPQQTDRLLELLHDAGVEFVVVGGVAAICHGSSTMTSDLDIAAPMTIENVEKLMAALRPHHPRHVTRPDLGVICDPVEYLAGFRMLLIETDLGRLDVLREVQPIGPVQALETVQFQLLEGKTFHVIGLEQLIEIKAFVGRPKDRIVEAELRALREQQHRS
ncbi:hypothetical protein [Enhygromyxa salina]|uniref:Nucleotidyltransferase n=1 Tax=Enhygromyxa salina TaxID=215803 RepID=A0A2S9YDE1_9BACT|nr:hypothetical protein [Enhygromyxa salina]PRQ03138.1 hypothetical protein ENSA7_54090 [Enhygromyxa salina]